MIGRERVESGTMESYSDQIRDHLMAKFARVDVGDLPTTHEVHVRLSLVHEFLGRFTCFGTVHPSD